MTITPLAPGEPFTDHRQRQAMKTDLHVTEIGLGEPIVFIHGAFDPPEETFREQKGLAAQYRVVLVDRRGYGESPAADRLDFDAQVEDILRVVGEGAHLVGQSSGGLLCLLAAAAHPQAVWTLTVIEPTAASIARGNEAVERLVARLAPLFALGAVMSPEQFAAAFYQALGFDAPSVELDERRAAAAATTAREPVPWDIEVPLDRLAAAPFSKLVVSGAWDIAPPLAREIAGSAFRVICDTLEKKLPAERAIFRGAAHNPQLLGKQFNDRLRSFLAAHSRI
jgi:pimeloyl-ACP methyl ester carboxylesterase